MNTPVALFPLRLQDIQNALYIRATNQTRLISIKNAPIIRTKPIELIISCIDPFSGSEGIKQISIITAIIHTQRASAIVPATSISLTDDLENIRPAI